MPTNKTLRQPGPRLDDAELEVVGGDRGKLIDKVRDAQSLSHEEAEVEVDSWANNLEPR